MRRPIPSEVKAGLRVQGPKGELRVMTVAEGYAMVSYKGCMPWCMPVRDLMDCPKTEAPQQGPSETP